MLSDGVAGTGNKAYGFTVWDGSLYTAGYFNYAGKTPANYVARWSGDEKVVSSTTNRWSDDWYHSPSYLTGLT